MAAVTVVVPRHSAVGFLMELRGAGTLTVRDLCDLRFLVEFSQTT